MNGSHDVLKSFVQPNLWLERAFGLRESDRFTSKNHPKPRSGRPRNRRQIDEMVELHNGRQFFAVPKQDTVCRHESALAESKGRIAGRSGAAGRRVHPRVDKIRPGSKAQDCLFETINS